MKRHHLLKSIAKKIIATYGLQYWQEWVGATKAEKRLAKQGLLHCHPNANLTDEEIEKIQSYLPVIMESVLDLLTTKNEDPFVNEEDERSSLYE